MNCSSPDNLEHLVNPAHLLEILLHLENPACKSCFILEILLMNVITAPLNPANPENLVHPAPNPAFRWGRLKLLTSLVLLLCLKSIGITPVARSQDFTYAGESVEATEMIITPIDEYRNAQVPGARLRS